MNRFSFDQLENWEKWLHSVLVMLLLTLVVLQFLFNREPERLDLNLARRLEGIPWPQGNIDRTAQPGRELVIDEVQMK